MFIAKKLTLQNYKSFGNKRVSINLNDFNGLTLVMGQNEDSPDENARNGCGKSTWLDALCFVLTGKSMRKSRSTGSLVNNVNEKGLLVEIDFELGQYECRIVRGLKPGKLKFFKKPSFKDGEITDTEFDCTRDSIANTNADILAFTRIDENIFKLAIVTAAKGENFFDMEAAKQKAIMESLFGYTLLTQKADAIKEMKKQRESDHLIEKTRLEERQVLLDKNKQKLESLITRSDAWEDNNTKQLSELDETIDALNQIDFEGQKALLEQKEASENALKDARNKVKTSKDNLSNYLMQVVKPVERKLGDAEKKLDDLSKIDIESAITAYDEYEKSKSELNEQLQSAKEAEREQNTLYQEVLKEINALKKERDSISDECPTCGQPWPDQAAREEKIAGINDRINELQEAFTDVETDLERCKLSVSEARLGIETLKKPSDFGTRDEAIRAASELESAKQSIKSLRDERDEAYAQRDNLETMVSDELEACSNVEAQMVSSEYDDLLVDNMGELVGYQVSLKESQKQKDQLAGQSNPYVEDIDELKDSIDNVVDTTVLIEIERDIKNHQDLITMLTKKDSGIRREVTSVRLPALNQFISEYLDQLDLQYIVKFNDDLSPSISVFDKPLDFSGLSSGEEERVGLALSLAFKKMFETMNFGINIFAVDERLDAGLCESGAERGVNLLYEMATTQNRNVFLVSHRGSLVDYANRIMMVTKKNGFSEVSFET